MQERRSPAPPSCCSAPSFFPVMNDGEVRTSQKPPDGRWNFFSDREGSVLFSCGNNGQRFFHIQAVLYTARPPLPLSSRPCSNRNASCRGRAVGMEDKRGRPDVCRWFEPDYETSPSVFRLPRCFAAEQTVPAKPACSLWSYSWKEMLKLRTNHKRISCRVQRRRQTFGQIKQNILHDWTPLE